MRCSGGAKSVEHGGTGSGDQGGGREGLLLEHLFISLLVSLSFSFLLLSMVICLVKGKAATTLGSAPLSTSMVCPAVVAATLLVVRLVSRQSSKAFHHKPILPMRASMRALSPISVFLLICFGGGLAVKLRHCWRVWGQEVPMDSSRFHHGVRAYRCIYFVSLDCSCCCSSHRHLSSSFW